MIKLLMFLGEIFFVIFFSAVFLSSAIDNVDSYYWMWLVVTNYLLAVCLLVINNFIIDDLKWQVAREVIERYVLESERLLAQETCKRYWEAMNERDATAFPGY